MAPGTAPVLKRKVETIQLLVHAGLNINEVDEERETPLHHSVEKGNIKDVRLLLQVGADKNMMFCHPSFGRVMLLELANQLGKEDMIEALEENEALEEVRLLRRMCRNK